MFSVCRTGRRSRAAIGKKLKVFYLKLSEGTFGFGWVVILGRGFQTGVEGSPRVLEGFPGWISKRFPGVQPEIQSRLNQQRKKTEINISLYQHVPFL